jgi:hypothetical protein
VSVSVLERRPGAVRDGITQWHFPSASSPGTVHVTTLHIDGVWDCSCPGFRCAQRMDGLCLHIDAAMAADLPLALPDILA